MFVSTDFLVIHYGVDQEIARFFVDREPPANNYYWKDKLLYLRFEPGYLFIPLIVDLIFKLGVNREQLLAEEFVQLMEGIGHVSALVEANKITYKEAIEECLQLAKPISKDDAFTKELINFMRGNNSLFSDYETGLKALHRGDLFLFAVCALKTGQVTYNQIVQFWFALISSLLLLDDAEDVQADLKNNEENAFLESGMNEEGFLRIKQLVQHNLQLISTINNSMALTLDKQLVEIFNKPYFQQFYKPN